MSYYDRMAALARLRLSERRRSVSIDELRLYEPAVALGDLSRLLRSPSLTLITEIRRTSQVLPGSDPQGVPSALARGLRQGAKAFSVLSRDENYGGHGLLDLAEASGLGMPLVFRDIVVDEYQLYEARFLGATAVSLIPEVLGVSELASMAEVLRHLELEVLIEAHDQNDIEIACCIKEAIVLLCGSEPESPDVNLEDAFRLVCSVPTDRLAVCACRGLQARDFGRLEGGGFDGCLVAEYVPKGLEAAQPQQSAVGSPNTSGRGR